MTRLNSSFGCSTTTTRRLSKGDANRHGQAENLTQRGFSFIAAMQRCLGVSVVKSVQFT